MLAELLNTFFFNQQIKIFFKKKNLLLKIKVNETFLTRIMNEVEEDACFHGMSQRLFHTNCTFIPIVTIMKVR